MHEALCRPLFESDVAALNETATDALGLLVHAKAWPVLDVTIVHSVPLRLRFTCDNWNDEPPSIAMLNPDGSPYSANLPGQVFNQGPHSSLGRSFICMRGSREYHTHSGHVNDRWETYKGLDGMNIVGILMQLRNSWKKLAR